MSFSYKFSCQNLCAPLSNKVSLLFCFYHCIKTSSLMIARHLVSSSTLADFKSPSHPRLWLRPQASEFLPFQVTCWGSHLSCHLVSSAKLYPQVPRTSHARLSFSGKEEQQRANGNFEHISDAILTVWWGLTKGVRNARWSNPTTKFRPNFFSRLERALKASEIGGTVSQEYTASDACSPKAIANSTPGLAVQVRTSCTWLEAKPSFLEVILFVSVDIATQWRLLGCFVTDVFHCF